MKTYIRAALNVQAAPYEEGKNLEDGFELWTNVITHGWINTDRLIQIKREDGKLVCPFVENKRGRIFIRENDYIICEDGEKHVCGAERFHNRFKSAE